MHGITLPCSCNQPVYRATTNSCSAAQHTFRLYTWQRKCAKSRLCSTVVCASLRTDRQALVEQFLQVVQQHHKDSENNELLNSTRRLVDQGVTVLVGSPEWQQLAQAFQLAAQQQSTTPTGGSSVQPATPQLTHTPPTPGQSNPWGMALRQPKAGPLQASVHSSSASETASSTTAAVQQQAPSMGQASRGAANTNSAHARNTPQTGGSSPWGFVLRQPRSSQAALPSDVSAPESRARTMPPSPAMPTKQQQQQQAAAVLQRWEWASVKQFVVLGLGSMGQCSKSPAAGVPPRLGFRLFQLILATTLARFMLPGLASQPIAYDPEFDEFDRALLGSLGFKALQHEPDHAVTCNTLMYMPCCPRELYSRVLEANQRASSLRHLAIFGTSMRSLTDSQALVEALTCQALAADNPADVGTADGIADAAADVESTKAVDAVQQAYQDGLVIEVLTPDCAAHGVGVAVHLFRS